MHIPSFLYILCLLFSRLDKPIFEFNSHSQENAHQKGKNKTSHQKKSYHQVIDNSAPNCMKSKSLYKEIVEANNANWI